MNTQRILTKKAGFNPDMGLIRYLVDQKPTTFGAAIQDTTGSEPELSVIRDGSPFGLKEVEEFLANAKDFPALIYFGEGKLATDSIQPIVLYDGDDKPFMVLGLEGDFSKFADAASGQTEEYNFVTKILMPKIADIADAVDGDHEKIMAFLNGNRFNELLLENIGHRGSLTILGKTGDPIWLGKNELGDTYDWGQTSNDHDYDGYLAQIKATSEAKAAAAAAAAAPVVAAKPGKFSFRGNKPATPPPLPQDVATKGDAPRASVPETKQVGATTIVDTKKRDAVRPPSWVHKNQDLDAWYLAVAGNIPSAKKKRIPIIPVIDNMPNNLADLMQLRADQLKADMANPKVKNETAIGPVKTETSAGAPKTGAEIAAVRAAENTPIIGPKEMEAILDVVAHIDSQANSKMTTADIQALEKKLGDFSTSVGCTWPEMMNWPVSGLFAIGNKPKGLHALIQIIMELRSVIRDNVKLEDLVGTDTTEKVVTTVTKSGEGTVKTESFVVEQQKAAPVKKGFQFRASKAA